MDNNKINKISKYILIGFGLLLPLMIQEEEEKEGVPI